MNDKPFPELTTKRLLLRRIKESDSQVILYLRSDKTINTYIERPENRKTKNINDAIKFIKEINKAFDTNKSISWGISMKTNSEIIGTICLWNFSKDKIIAEVGYDLNPSFQKKGIMTEALKKIVDYGFNNLNLDKIEAFTHKENENSKKLLEKNGFHLKKDRKDLENNSNIIFELNNPNL